MKLSRGHSRCRAFTLVEILTVVAIAVVLFVLAFSVVGPIRAAGAATKCIGNMRQIYIMTQQFATDHRNMLPPPIGESSSNNNGMTAVHESYNVNNYWWSNAYLGRYLFPDNTSRSRYSAGALTQKEAEIFNCPARFVDGKDSNSNFGTPAISYVMLRPEYVKGAATPRNSQTLRQNFNLRTMEDKPGKAYLAEGRKHTIIPEDARSGKIGETNNSAMNANRLRRFHNNGFNVLFYDGHVERFNDSDPIFRQRFFN